MSSFVSVVCTSVLVNLSHNQNNPNHQNKPNYKFLAGPGRKVKRVSDVSAMGIASPSAPAFVPAPVAQNLGVNPQNSQFNSPNQNFYSPETSPNMNMGYGGGPSPNS